MQEPLGHHPHAGADRQRQQLLRPTPTARQRSMLNALQLAVLDKVEESAVLSWTARQHTSANGFRCAPPLLSVNRKIFQYSNAGASADAPALLICTGGVAEPKTAAAAPLSAKAAGAISEEKFFADFQRAQLPQSKPDGFDSSLWEGAFGIAGKFPAKAANFAGGNAPLGGAVAQRLRGYKWRSEKSVKAIAPTGAALSFFVLLTSALGLSEGVQPLAR